MELKIDIASAVPIAANTQPAIVFVRFSMMSICPVSGTALQRKCAPFIFAVAASQAALARIAPRR
jgi:hypothetical protein